MMLHSCVLNWWWWWWWWCWWWWCWSIHSGRGAWSAFLLGDDDIPSIFHIMTVSYSVFDIPYSDAIPPVLWRCGPSRQSPAHGRSPLRLSSASLVQLEASTNNVEPADRNSGHRGRYQSTTAAVRGLCSSWATTILPVGSLMSSTAAAVRRRRPGLLIARRPRDCPLSQIGRSSTFAGATASSRYLRQLCLPYTVGVEIFLVYFCSCRVCIGVVSGGAWGSLAWQTACTSLQTLTHEHLITHFLQAECSSWRLTNSVKALKA